MQIIRIYQNEGWSGMFGNDEQTRLVVNQQEQRDGKRGPKPDVVVTQVKTLLTSVNNT